MNAATFTNTVADIEIQGIRWKQHGCQKETDEAPGDFSKKIWLAGLGAYGRAYDETHYEKATQETPRLFKELVKKGEELETNTRKRFNHNEICKNATTLEERIHKVRENMGFGFAGDDLERIEQKIDKLSKKVDELEQAVQLKTRTVAKQPNR